MERKPFLCLQKKGFHQDFLPQQTRGFSLTIALNVNRSTSNLLTFKIHYQDIIRQKIKSIACQGVTWSLLSEALWFITYLSLYLHRIVRFYFFCFLTFIFSFDWCFGGKNVLWLCKAFQHYVSVNLPSQSSLSSRDKPGVFNSEECFGHSSSVFTDHFLYRFW